MDEFWDDIEPHLVRFERETHLASAESVRAWAKERTKQLWGFHDGEKLCGVVVTEVYPTTRGEICCIWAACGSASNEQILKTFTRIEEWARQIGCVALEIKGRPGWQRLLPGFKRTAIVLEKSLYG